MGILDSLVGYMGFNLIHTSLNRVMERNMANNFTALFHATSCVSMGLVCLYGKDVYYCLSKFSTGYFLYDTVQSIKYIKSPMNMMYVYHHLATSYYLHQDHVKYNCAKILFFGELSNIPSYFVYYLIKRGNDTQQLELAKKIQFFTYSLIRLPIATYLTYDALVKADDKTPVYLMIPVYLMGLVWTKALWKNL